MTKIEINRKLAVAIGYLPEHIRLYGKDVEVLRNDSWYLFNYQRWEIIAPIAERYDLFPTKDSHGKWRADLAGRRCDTPQEAIALEVIACAEEDLL